MYNIIAEPLIRINIAGVTRYVSLPEVFAGLMADEVDSFPALRPHQRHAWHAFLVQLGAMAMNRAGVSEPSEDPTEWAALFRGLTLDWPDDEPWQLVVDDITQPAFMQPPVSSKEREKDYKNRVESADELDMLVTAKNHDLKATTVAQAETDDWMFALVTPQTMDGNPGRNPGISRMNGSYGNRPAFSLAPTRGTGAHIRRDITALINNHPEKTATDKHTLLWLLPWDGAHQLLLSELSPLYIEICRRIRLQSSSEKPAKRNQSHRNKDASQQ